MGMIDTLLFVSLCRKQTENTRGMESTDLESSPLYLTRL